MSENLKTILDNLEAYHLAAANEATKAKKLLEEEGKTSSSRQRVTDRGAIAVARRMKTITKNAAK